MREMGFRQQRQEIKTILEPNRRHGSCVNQQGTTTYALDAAATATRRKAMSRRQRQRQQATQAKRQPAYMPYRLADVFAQMERERKQREQLDAQRRD